MAGRSGQVREPPESVEFVQRLDFTVAPKELLITSGTCGEERAAETLIVRS